MSLLLLLVGVQSGTVADYTNSAMMGSISSHGIPMGGHSIGIRGHSPAISGHTIPIRGAPR